MELNALTLEGSISPTPPAFVPLRLFLPGCPPFVSQERKFSAGSSWNMVWIPLYLEKHPWSLRYAVGTSLVWALTKCPSPPFYFVVLISGHLNDLNFALKHHPWMFTCKSHPRPLLRKSWRTNKHITSQLDENNASVNASNVSPRCDWLVNHLALLDFSFLFSEMEIIVVPTHKAGMRIEYVKSLVQWVAILLERSCAKESC